MRRTLCAVAALALICLLLRAARVGIAGDYLDPVGNITAQDEALYVHSAIRMARGSDGPAGFLTPRLLGRFATYKPPMLMWLSGTSARIFGISRLSLRLPVAILCSLIAGLLFLWAAEMRDPMAGALAAALLIGNRLWLVTSAMCLTDGLLAAFDTAAIYCLFYDPWLESPLAFWGFAASVAAAILTKTIAGVIPLVVLACYWLAAHWDPSPRKRRPTLARACAAAALALALAAPWFAYEMIAHGRWFWTEHVQVELIGFGSGAPPQTSSEPNGLFYLTRMALTDPVLLAFAVVALAGFFAQLRQRSASTILLLCWLAPLLAALNWRYRNATYLIPVLPPLALLAATGLPSKSRSHSIVLVGLALTAFVVKCAFPEQPWGLSLQAGTVQKAAAPLSNYCAQARGNELILMGMEDDLYAAVLPLAKLRYALLAPPAGSVPPALDFASMGITLTTAQFNNLPAFLPVFQQHLREWGIDSLEPVGTLIMAANPRELADMIRAHPSSDFFLPQRYRADVEAAAQPDHIIQQAPPDALFLLSRGRLPRPSPPSWPCYM